jgi:hypothetical protein
VQESYRREWEKHRENASARFRVHKQFLKVQHVNGRVQVLLCKLKGDTTKRQMPVTSGTEAILQDLNAIKYNRGKIVQGIS